MSLNKFGHSFKRLRKSVEYGPPGRGFQLTTTGDYDVENKRITNLNLVPKDDLDAVSKAYVDETLQTVVSSIKGELFQSVNKTIQDDIETLIVDYQKQLDSIVHTVVIPKVLESKIRATTGQFFKENVNVVELERRVSELELAFKLSQETIKQFENDIRNQLKLHFNLLA
jgi:hypothetical protein